MGFSPVNNLEGSHLACYFSQALRVGEQEVRPLIRSSSPRKANSDRSRGQLYDGPPLYLSEKLPFSLGVGFNDFIEGNAYGIAQVEIVLSPPLYVKVVEALKGQSEVQVRACTPLVTEFMG